MKTNTRDLYSKRLEKAIEYLFAHLHEPVSLERLAEEACFSPYHFHRIYQSMVGESIAETLRRIRLHHAAKALLEGKESLSKIAQTAGYGSVQAFTRAFGEAYGVPPAAYRNHPLFSLPLQNQEPSMYTVTIRDVPAISVAALRHVGPYMEIGQAFERLYAWAVGKNILGPTARHLGIYYDDPTAVAPNQLRSDACMTVPADCQLEEPFRVATISAGRYAVLLHIGPYAELEKAYQWLYGSWLPQSGHEVANGPCFEEYLNNPKELPPTEWRTEICLPLRT